MSDLNDLKAFHGDAWALLERGVADRRSPARHPTFATVSPQGRPEARTVVLRAARRADAEIEVHSDTRAAKIAALEQTPHAAIHIWHPGHRLQIRLMTRVHVAGGASVKAKWDRVPDGSRTAYGAEPTPGTRIAEAGAYTHAPKLENFAVLTCAIEEMELLHLGDPHRRARFLREED